MVKKHKETVYTKALKIKSVVYNTGPHSVTITLAKPYKGAVQVTIEPGLEAANGASSSSRDHTSRSLAWIATRGKPAYKTDRRICPKKDKLSPDAGQGLVRSSQAWYI